MTTRRDLLRYGLPVLLTGCGGGGGGSAPTPPPPAPPPPAPPPTPIAGAPLWAGYAGSAQHQAISGVASQGLSRVLWTTPVDLFPPYRSGGFLLIHYGSPAITATGTVLLPVRTSSSTTVNTFRMEARVGATGALLWQQDSAYTAPVSSWTPSCSVAVDANNRAYFPESGGRLLRRDSVDTVSGTVARLCFYGDTLYASNAAALDAAIQVCTPLTIGSDGAVYFGMQATAGNIANVASGFVRIAADGTAGWASAVTLTGGNVSAKPAMNAAPALSLDGATLYVAMNTAPDPSTGLQTGWLAALDASTLALKSRQSLTEPRTSSLAYVSDSSTASPLVGPDGQVFYGVLEGSRSGHNARGWLLHFDATLASTLTPGSFGWDDTPSIVAASLVSSYTGTSSYLLLSKYNNYYGTGTGDGQNQMAILDPHAAQADRISPAVQVMKEVLTITGPTPDTTTPGGVREWCVNTAVVDPATASVLMNNEDGVLYRWDLRTNRLSESLRLNGGVGQAYTPTVIGKGGIVYAINNATLNAVGA